MTVIAARAHDTAEVLDAMAEHVRATKPGSPMWAVTLLDGVNDSTADARRRSPMPGARVLTRDTGGGRGSRVIDYNSIDADAASDPFRSARRAMRERAFRRCAGQPRRPAVSSAIFGRLRMSAMWSAACRASASA